MSANTRSNECKNGVCRSGYRPYIKSNKQEKEEVEQVMKYFGIPEIKAIKFLREVKVVYKMNNLDWDATSKAIKKL